jgi:uncharacterized protein YbjT (DUF2867 family)
METKRILITGATGNVGFEIIRFLYRINLRSNIFAGVRNLSKAKLIFTDFKELRFAQFDIEDAQTFETSLNGIDTVFLLRPPHISDVEKYIRPLLLKIKEKGIKQILFLSVQGAEKSGFIPHN